MRRLRLYLLLALALFVAHASAVVPESGLYWNPARSGLGYYIEVQGTTVVFLAYASDPDTGEPLFYLAAGEMTKAIPRLPPIADVITPPPPRFPYEYPYQFKGTLYRFTNGPCLTCVLANWVTSDWALDAGQVELRFSDRARVELSVQMNNGESISDVLYRTLFARGGHDLGRDDGMLLPDLRGEWVFTDQTDTQRPAWRFHFTEMVGPTFLGAELGRAMQFVDPMNNAVMHCTKTGCALVDDGVRLFWAKTRDIGAESLLGYVDEDADEIPTDENQFFYRSGHLITGARMHKPTPDAAPPPDE